MCLKKIVIGTWSLSGDFGPVRLMKIETVLKYAYEKGFREYDTAPAYGNGFMEFCLGKVFSESKDVIVNTKVGNLPFIGKSFNLNDIRASFEESIKRLNGLPINILFLHNPRDEIKYYASIVDYMFNLKEKGIIKLVGLSKAKGFPYENKIDLNIFDVIQEDLNLLYLKPMNYLPSIKPIFMVHSPLASGLLSGKLGVKKVFHATDQRAKWLEGERLKSLLKRVDALKNISGSTDISSLAKRFLFSVDGIDKIIFGVKSKSHIDKLLADFHAPKLDKILIRSIIDLYNRDYGLSNEGQYKY